MYQFNMTVFLLVSRPQFSLDCNAWRLEQDFALRRVSVATLQRRSVLCNFSHLTEDDREIYMNTGVVELHNALKKINKTNNIQIEESFKTSFYQISIVKMWPSLTCGIRFF